MARKMEAGPMPGASCGIHYASAVMTLAVSMLVTALLVLAAAETRPGAHDPACRARGACQHVLSR